MREAPGYDVLSDPRLISEIEAALAISSSGAVVEAHAQARNWAGHNWSTYLAASRMAKLILKFHRGERRDPKPTSSITEHLTREDLRVVREVTERKIRERAQKAMTAARELGAEIGSPETTEDPTHDVRDALGLK